MVRVEWNSTNLSICSVTQAVPAANAFVHLNGNITLFNAREGKALFGELQANVTSTIDAYLYHFGNTVFVNEETDEIQIASGTNPTTVAPKWKIFTHMKRQIDGKMNTLTKGTKGKKVKEVPFNGDQVQNGLVTAGKENEEKTTFKGDHVQNGSVFADKENMKKAPYEGGQVKKIFASAGRKIASLFKRDKGRKDQRKYGKLKSHSADETAPLL